MTRSAPARELYSHLPEFSQLYAERKALLENDAHGSLDPAWVRRRLKLVTREIDRGLVALSEHDPDMDPPRERWCSGE